VRLVCAKCGRRGDYAVDRLHERFGDATLIKVRETLSADCGAARATRPTIAGRFSNGEAVGRMELLRCAIVNALRRAQPP
jgi:hypothetical protein